MEEIPWGFESPPRHHDIKRVVANKLQPFLFWFYWFNKYILFLLIKYFVVSFHLIFTLKVTSITFIYLWIESFAFGEQINGLKLMILCSFNKLQV